MCFKFINKNYSVNEKIWGIVLKRIIFILFVLMLITACKKNYISEVEPNNSFVESTLIELDKDIRGYLENENDVDVYQLIVTEKKSVRIELSAVKGVNHAISIFRDESGKRVLVKEIDDARKSSSEIMTNIAMKNGRYYIKIHFGDRDQKKGNEKVQYNLKLISSELLFEEEEANDTYKTATDLPSGEKFSGYFYPAFNKKNTENESREYDFFMIDPGLADNQYALLDVTLTGVEGVDSVLKIYDPFMNLIVESNVLGSGREENLKDIGLTRPGKYYIQIYSANYEVNPVSNYSIQANIKPYDPSVEMEPNNSTDKANKMVENIINGKIFPQGDEDWYSFSPQDGMNIFRVEVIPPSDIDIKIDVISLNGNTIYTIDNSGSGEKEYFPNIYSKDPFKIRVYSNSAEGNPDMTYAVSVNSRKIEPEEETEPNDERETASVVKKNVIKGYISKNQDVDYYSIKVNTRVKVKFAISGIDDREIEISVADSLGYIIKTITVNSKEVVEFEEMIDGKGFIIVKTNGNVSSDPYFIELGE